MLCYVQASSKQLRTQRPAFLSQLRRFGWMKVTSSAQDYLRYYHADRTHDGLDKDTPEGRPKSIRNPGERLSSLPRLGGLHHRYSWEEAA
jgi:hypothetical protein